MMKNCMENAKKLQEGLEKTGRFEIISKEKGVPLVAFTFKDKDQSLAFKLSKALRHYGWIVPAYTMPADLEHMTVLRIVVREDFARGLVEKLLTHVETALKEIDAALISRSIPRITFTVELNQSGDGGALLPTKVQWEPEHEPEHEPNKIEVKAGKTKGAC